VILKNKMDLRCYDSLSKKFRRCGAHLRKCQELPRAALRFVPVPLAFALLAAFCLYGQVSQKQAKRTFAHDRDVETAFQWQAPPRWEGEFLVGYINNGSSGPVIFTIDRNGRRQETLFTLKDAGWIDVIDAAVSQTGEIAAVGSAIGGDRATCYVARIAADRKSQIVTRVWPYCAMTVTFAADGTIWTIGHIKNDQDTGALAYHVLRRFDPSGKLLGSLTLDVMGRGTDETSRLRASRNRVGWFTRNNEYLEFSLDGSELDRYEGPEGATHEEITGVTIGPENEVVASRFRKGKTEFLTLDRENRTWIPVSIPTEYAPDWARVLGFDGTTLVTNSVNGRMRRFHTK
jgi:hypothetical protein